MLPIICVHAIRQEGDTSIRKNLNIIALVVSPFIIDPVNERLMSTLHGSTLLSHFQGAIGGDAKSVADAQRLLKGVIDGPAVALTGREQGDNDLGCGIHREEGLKFGDFAKKNFLTPEGQAESSNLEGLKWKMLGLDHSIIHNT